jgi:SAM-dependent methyltransferase
MSRRWSQRFGMAILPRGTIEACLRTPINSMDDIQTSSSSLGELPLSPALPLPAGQTEESITTFLGSIELEGAPKQELDNYWRQDWRRFIYTYGLVRDFKGACLELGANPYFTTMLLRYFTRLDLTLANYFGPHFGVSATQTLSIRNPSTEKLEKICLEFEHFNTEDASFPFSDGCFEVVLFCEVIEHLQSDPVSVLREIKRVLKPGGHLILTTPNVSRLENVCRMIQGANIYDPYSGYGPYGRHNREYNKHELASLLSYCGFDIDLLFSADVHDNSSVSYASLEAVIPLVKFREADLGQYLFLRSRSSRPAGRKRPAWLYRSYPPDELETAD